MPTSRSTTRRRVTRCPKAAAVSTLIVDRRGRKRSLYDCWSQRLGVRSMEEDGVPRTCHISLDGTFHTTTQLHVTPIVSILSDIQKTLRASCMQSADPNMEHTVARLNRNHRTLIRTSLPSHHTTTHLFSQAAHLCFEAAQKAPIP